MQRRDNIQNQRFNYQEAKYCWNFRNTKLFSNFRNMSNISIFSHNRSLLTWDIQMLAYPVDWLWEIRKGLLVSMVHLGNKRLIYLSLYIIWLNCGSFTLTISYTKCGPILIQGLESGNKVGCEHMLLLNFKTFLHL